MNFEDFRKLIGDANEAIRMEQSLYYGGKGPLDTYAVPFDTFVDVCRSMDENDHMYSGMRITVLNKDSVNYPQMIVQLGVNGGGETIADWRLVEAGIFKSREDIIECFKTKIIEERSYIQCHIVPVGFEFFVVDIDGVFMKYRCMGHDMERGKILLDNVTSIKIWGDDYQP